MFLLILLLLRSEFKNKNIFKEEAESFTIEFRDTMIKLLKKKGHENLIIFNDKNNDEFNRVEEKLTKQIDKAQYSLENPDDSDQNLDPDAAFDINLKLKQLKKKFKKQDMWKALKVLK